jgi:IPT/TIG domain
MSANRLFSYSLGLILTLTLLSCGGGGGGTNEFTSPDQPCLSGCAFVTSIDSVSPTTISIGSPATTLTVTGTNFVQGATVMWNTTALTTSFVSDSQLTATVPASALTGPPVTIAISVLDPPSTNAGSSNSLGVQLQNPLPAIASLNPTGVVLGSNGFTLTVNGSNFVSGATVYWNGTSRVTTYVNSNELTAVILASDLALPSATAASVTVQNPSPSAGISSAASFGVENPSPAISSITPTSGLAGSGYSIAVTGTGFMNGASAQFGSIVVPASYNNPTSISVTVPPSAPVGAVTLTVSNPQPNAGTSNSVTVTNNAAGPGGSFLLVSIGTNNTVMSGFGEMSRNGRYFAFENLVRDTCLGAPTGCVPTTVDYIGAATPGPRIAGMPTNDGLYVASSHQGVTTLQPNDLEFSSTCLGTPACTPSTQVFDTQSALQLGSTSADGRYISYYYNQPSVSSSGYIYDTCNGATNCTPTSIAIDPTETLVQSTPVTDDRGRYAAYQSQSPTHPEALLTDTCLGAVPGCAPLTTVFSDPNQSCSNPVISGDAEWIAYNCQISGQFEVFLTETCAGASGGTSSSCSPPPTLLVSDPNFASYVRGVSSGGRFVTYESSGGMIAGQSLPFSMVFVYDTCYGAPSGCTPQAAPVCLNSQGAIADGGCSGGQLSSDGQYINVSSQAQDLTPLPTAIAAWGASYIFKNPLF